MKKILLIMMMAITSMMASAGVDEWSLGGQFVFGTEGSMPGVGLKFQGNMPTTGAQRYRATIISRKRGDLF